MLLSQTKERSMSTPEYSVIVPIYNEEEGLAECLMELDRQLAGEPCEIVLVNDGSSDRSGEILKELSMDRAIVVEHKTNRGYGAALKTGIGASTSDILVITDADGTYPNERIPSLVGMLTDEYSMVVGQREKLNIPLIRRPAKYCLTQLANYLTRTKIPDLNSGLRVFRRELVERFINILPDTFSFTTTITLATLTNNLNVLYTPIQYHKRSGSSKIHPIKDTLLFIQLIVRTMIFFDPLRVFVPLSLILFLIGVGVFFTGLMFLPYPLETMSAVFITSSVNVLAVGMLADLIHRKLS